MNKQTINKNLQTVEDVLRTGPKNISDVAEQSDITVKTARNYLTSLQNLGKVEWRKGKKNEKLFYLKEPDNYFQIPLEKDQENIIKSIYGKIERIMSETKQRGSTHAFKILWKVNKELDLGLPIAWYKFGPCSIIPYENKKNSNLDKTISNKVKDVSEEYLQMDKYELQETIYEEEERTLYLVKNDILNADKEEERRTLYLDFLQSCPQQTKDLVMDFVTIAHRTGWNEKVRESFTDVWEYVTRVTYKDGLETFFEKDLSVYFDKKIETSRKEANASVSSLIERHKS